MEASVWWKDFLLLPFYLSWYRYGRKGIKRPPTNFITSLRHQNGILFTVRRLFFSTSDRKSNSKTIPFFFFSSAVSKTNCRQSLKDYGVIFTGVRPSAPLRMSSSCSNHLTLSNDIHYANKYIYIYNWNREALALQFYIECSVQCVVLLTVLLVGLV